jgi:hypothetical protein
LPRRFETRYEIEHLAGLGLGQRADLLVNVLGRIHEYHLVTVSMLEQRRASIDLPRVGMLKESPGFRLQYRQ